MLSADKAMIKLNQIQKVLDADQVLTTFIQAQKKLAIAPIPRDFLARLKAQLPALIQQLGSIYADDADFTTFIQKLIAKMYASYSERPAALAWV